MNDRELTLARIQMALDVAGLNLTAEQITVELTDDCSLMWLPNDVDLAVFVDAVQGTDHLQQAIDDLYDALGGGDDGQG